MFAAIRRASRQARTGSIWQQDRAHPTGSLSSPEQHNALRINTNEYLLPSRQWVKRRAASDKLLTTPKEMHLGEVALKDRLVDARGPDVTLADGPQRRNLQVNRTY